MLAFYIDEALTESEEADLLSVLKMDGHKLDRMEYKRIPCIFPTDKVSNEKMLEVLKGHVRNAGVPTGVQSIFIVPKDGIRWAILLQQAFYDVTGFYPYMIQQWQRSSVDGIESIARRDYLHMIDMHGAMTGEPAPRQQ